MTVVALSGAFVAFKKEIEYLQPASRTGGEGSLETFKSPAEIAAAVLALELPGVQNVDAIDRIELRPGKRMYKVRLAASSAWRSPRELQFDAATGAVLNQGLRGDQLWMDVHSFAVFGNLTKLVVMSLAGLSLLWLSLSGLYLFLFPPWFRARKRQRLAESTRNRNVRDSRVG